MAKLKGMFNGFWRYRYLLWNLVSRDFKLKYRRSVLGVLWSVLNPLLMCLVYWAVFSSLMDNENWSPLRFKSQPSRGGTVENITFEDL